MKTKIFCDSADYKTIKYFNKKSIVDGFTTNPSLMRFAGAKNYKDYSFKILKICKKKPISFEVFADNPKEMLKQAYKITIYLDSEADPENWLPDALDMNIVNATVYGHDVEPIDIENPENKWIKDLSNV